MDNGKPPAKVEVQKPLKESRRGHIEAGLRAYQEAAQENEELKAEIDRQRRDLLAREMEVASLKERADQMTEAHSRELTVIESRLNDCQAARDLAVSEKVALETILSSMRSIFRLAPLPTDEPTGG